MTPAEQKTLTYLDELFEDNFEILRHESGRSISLELKEDARRIVRAYWLRLRDIAKTITDTEVKLSLPERKTAKKRRYTLLGTVDLVREKGKISMYDIKTHEMEYLKANPEEVTEQLNVYGHIWQELRQNRLDEAAALVLSLPAQIKHDLPGVEDDLDKLEKLLADWDPVMPVELNKSSVNQTIAKFAGVVDQIIDNEFEAPPVSRLNEDLIEFTDSKGVVRKRGKFATRICRNCDARFSCKSYRQYMFQAGGNFENRFRQYLDDFGTDEERTERLIANADKNENTISRL